MPDFTTRLADGWERALADPTLALVPIALGFLQVRKLLEAVGNEGFHLSFRLSTPASVVTVWDFAGVPNQGFAVYAGVPVEASAFALLAVPVFVVVQAALASGYFGSIAALLRDGEYEFALEVRRHFVPFLLFTLVPVVIFLPAALLTVGAGAVGGVGAAVGLLLVVLIPVMFAAAYLFYAVPYLIVLRETDLVSAARRSYALAVEGGPYAAYFVGFLGFSLLLSPFASLVVVNVPVIGPLVGVVAGGVVGLAANVATMRFVADLDPGSPSLGEWPNASGPTVGAAGGPAES